MIVIALRLRVIEITARNDHYGEAGHAEQRQANASQQYSIQTAPLLASRKSELREERSLRRMEIKLHRQYAKGSERNMQTGVTDIFGTNPF